MIDTGSNLVIVVKKDCKECGNHLNKYFDYNNSTTFKFMELTDPICQYKRDKDCLFSINYLEGS